MTGDLFAAYIPSSGACPDCDADTELKPDADVPGLVYMLVRHDDTCPHYRRMKAEGSAS
ncbi:hypothetical protein [Isoptericola sp. NPDC055881]